MSDGQVRCQLRMPDLATFADQIHANAQYATSMAVANTRLGQSVVICGAGPSLADEHARLPASDEVWACNSALPYLMDRAVPVTHGFAIDQHEAMLNADEWQRTFDVDYLIASSVHPSLVAHLLEQHRSLTFFHNHIGIPNPDEWTDPIDFELSLYRTLYPVSVRAGHGLNAVPRAVCLAIAMGFDSITVIGADCACRPNAPPMPAPGTPAYRDWLASLVMYADGRSPAVYGPDTPLAQSDIDGTRWHTRPDMLVSAMHLVELQEAFTGRLTFVGHTLPNALRNQSRAFWSQLPTLTPRGEVIGFGNAAASSSLELVA